MLNISFLVCTIVIGPVFCKWGTLKAYSDLDSTMLNIELVLAIFIYYNVFYVPRSISFELSCKNSHTHTQTYTRAHTNTDTHKHRHTNTDAHRDSDEYSIVAFFKNTRIKIGC